MFRTKSKPNRSFKKGIDKDESRRKREEVTVELRKSKREEQMMKRRLRADGLISGLNTNTNSAQNSGANSPRNADVSVGDIPRLTNALRTGGDEKVKTEAVTSLRQLLSIERNPPIKEVIEAGVIPDLIQFLGYTHNTNLQFESAWTLTNIASGSQQDTAAVVEAGAVGPLVQLLNSPNSEVCEQSVWALGNIAGDSAAFRDEVLRHGALQALQRHLVPQSKITMLRNATWTLSNFCRGKPRPSWESVAGALPTLRNLISSNDQDILTDACWALSYLSDDTGSNNQKIQGVVEAGVCPRLVQLLSHKSQKVRTPALRTIGNIVTGDDNQTQVVMNCGAMASLLKMLSDSSKSIRKEAAWAISNITAGNHLQIEEIINANIIPVLIAMLRNDEFDVQKEVTWALSNATSGGKDEQIQNLVHQGIIPPMCDMMKCRDMRIVLVAMEAVENILKIGKKLSANSFAGEGTNPFAEYVEECGGLDILDSLQRHDNEDVYEKAVQILTDYFNVEEEEDEGVAPQVAADNSQFAFGGAAQGNNASAGNAGFSF